VREPLHLGYVVEDYPTFLVDEIRQLRALGARVTLLSTFRPEPQPDPVKDAYRRESVYLPPGALAVLAANLRCFLRRPLAYLGTALFLARHGQALRMLVLGACHARVVRDSGIDHLHGTFGTRTTTLAYVISRLSGVDYSFTTHAYDIFTPNPSLVWKTNNSRFMRTISRFNERFMADTYEGLDASKIRVEYLGVDLEAFKPVSNGRGGRAEMLVSSVADLIPKKGHGYLVRACALLAERGVGFACEIGGAGPLEGELARDIADAELGDRVRLLGRLNHSDVRGLLERSDVFVLACVDMRASGEHMDGIPVALMEAMAMGIPVVSTTVAGIPELIEDGVSGFLVPERDEAALAAALERLASDVELRAEMGRNARARVARQFDLAANTRRLADLFERRGAVL
jgi:colanic acid/amylovoran biosynthesis glycosyltransferase